MRTFWSPSSSFRAAANSPDLCRLYARAERPEFPVHSLQFGVACDKQRREPVAVTDQLLYPAGALFEGGLQLLASLA